jgi:hypothetical protein
MRNIRQASNVVATTLFTVYISANALAQEDSRLGGLSRACRADTMPEVVYVLNTKIPVPRYLLPGVSATFFAQPQNVLARYWSTESFTIYYRNSAFLFNEAPNPYWFNARAYGTRTSPLGIVLGRYQYTSGWEGQGKWFQISDVLGDSFWGIVRARAGTGTINQQNLFERYDIGDTLVTNGEHRAFNTQLSRLIFLPDTVGTTCDIDNWGPSLF